MGSSISIMTLLAACTTSYTTYLPNNAVNQVVPGYVLGCTFAFHYGNTNDLGNDPILFFNSTSNGTAQALGGCYIPASDPIEGCTTNYSFVLTGAPYSYETFTGTDLDGSPSVSYQNASLTVFVIPPVPSQARLTFINSSNTPATSALLLNSSLFSAEYGSNITGCLLHYGPTPYTPGILPALLDNINPANNHLPSRSLVVYNQTQASSLVVLLASLPGLSGGAAVSGMPFDYHYVCYNAAGASPDTPLYNLAIGPSASPAPVRVTSSSGAVRPVTSYTSSPCVCPITTGTASLCFLMYSLPGNVDYPWSVATSVLITYNNVSSTTANGTTVQVISGSGVRVFTNRFGEVTQTPLTIAPLGTSGSNNLLYLNSSVPVDSSGITYNFTTGGIQLPGQGPAVLYSTVNVYNTSLGVVVEGGSSRVDQAGSAFLSSVPGFANTTIGAANINALAPNYASCQAPITFTNGLRQPTQPSVSNGATRLAYTYFISDGSSYSVQGNLTISTTLAFATTKDMLGNPYQTVTNVVGTRLYTYLPTNTQLLSQVNGLSLAAYPRADQRFYPYTLLASGPGVYSVNSAPFFDNNGIEFAINPPAPVAGLPPGYGTLYNATSLYFTTQITTAVLTEGFYLDLPLSTLQTQTYALLQ